MSDEADDKHDRTNDADQPGPPDRPRRKGGRPPKPRPDGAPAKRVRKKPAPRPRRPRPVGAGTPRGDVPDVHPGGPPALTERARRFVDEYLRDGNATQAAIRAGYAPAGAAAAARQLMAKPAVREAVARGRSERARRCRISAAWVIKRLVENVRRSMQAEPVRDRKGEPTGEYQYQGAVANRALELLGKHLGMFVEKVAPTDPTGTTEYAGGLTDADRLARLAELLRRAQSAAGADDGQGGGDDPGA